MNPILSAALLLAALAISPAYAAGASHDAHAGHGAAPVSSSAGLVDGVVKKIDKAGGKVTVAHGPLTNLNMPAMTMAFRVKDAAWIDKLKEGDKIRFMADNVNGAITVVHFEAGK